MVDRFVTGLVLAAGSSRRLGQPKQLLPYRGGTLLDAILDVARSADLDQRIVTIGGAGSDVVDRVRMDDFEVVESLHFTAGCSSSIVAALDVVDPRASGIVMLVGDQPGVDPEVIGRLIDSMGDEPLGVCRYSDGIGHPFWFGRAVFGDLTRLHGDKAVWKLIESSTYDVFEFEIDGSIPPDVDTWDDYVRLVSGIDTGASP